MRSFHFFAARVKVFLRESKLAFLLLFFWFLAGFCVYFFVLRFSLVDSLAAIIFFKVTPHTFSVAYAMWSQGIIFGIIFTLLVQNMFARHNPERGCRMLAQEMKDHIVVVGYSHLGSRLIEHCKAAGLAYCLIEKDRGAVDDLLRAGTPVVVDDARELGTLSDAGVAHAKMVIIASNNLETALMVTKRARQLNKLCQIVVRCFHDDFEDILESLGANEIISSSKNAFCDILKRCTL